jgi:serine/threonine protein kinase
MGIEIWRCSTKLFLLPTIVVSNHVARIAFRANLGNNALLQLQGANLHTHSYPVDAPARETTNCLLASMKSTSGAQDETCIYGRESDHVLSAAPLPAAAPHSHIGPYTLLEQLGEGGMGTVYLAEQEQPVRRRVALKIIKTGMDSAQIVARFEAERQALALMDHPNIATVLDVGATAAGLPYFAMELVAGVPIATFCDEQRLSTRERLQLFVPVCQAIQHAHQKGIIHRDIKPSNVLVTLSDGKPVPKVIDFGLAKATEQRPAERTMFTQYGAVVGTLQYMSPEQAEMSPEGVDTRSDVYSLGALLYELLTGTAPLGQEQLSQASFSEVLKMVASVEPRRPSAQLSSSDHLPAIAAARRTEPAKLPRLLKGELDWIVMKCLEKDRARRYESASALARDIEHFLADEPVDACPPSASYRMRRFARKYRGPLAAAFAFAVLLISAAAVSTWQAMRATRAERGQRLAAQEMKAERDRTRLALTREVAERLDGDLRRLATAADVLAVTVGERPDWDESQLESWLRTLLEKQEEVFALNVGFEPGAFDAAREDFCLYIFRGPRGIEKKYLLPPSYVPLYREWDWYTKPRDQRRGMWSEPYVDTGGGDIPMVTYTAPMTRLSEFIGVLSLDLSVEYFGVLRQWLTELNFGANSYGFVISESGVIISHPYADYDLAQLAAAGKEPRRITELSTPDDAFAALAKRMLTDREGSGIAVDPATGKRTTFLFSKARSADWTFVAAIADRD